MNSAFAHLSLRYARPRSWSDHRQTHNGQLKRLFFYMQMRAAIWSLYSEVQFTELSVNCNSATASVEANRLRVGALTHCAYYHQCNACGFRWGQWFLLTPCSMPVLQPLAVYSRINASYHRTIFLLSSTRSITLHHPFSIIVFTSPRIVFHPADVTEQFQQLPASALHKHKEQSWNMNTKQEQDCLLI